MKLSMARFAFLISVFSAAVSAEEAKNQKFYCGKNCMSYKKVEITIFVDGHYKKQETFIKGHILKYKKYFHEKIENLEGYREIKFSSVVVTNTPPLRYFTESSSLNVFVIVKPNKYKEDVFSVSGVSMFGEVINLYNEDCLGDDCISNNLDKIMEIQVVNNLRDIYPAAVK